MLARSIRRTSILLTLLAVLALTAGAAISAQPAVGQADVQAATDDSDASFRSSPVMFIENAGQWPEAARFQVWGGNAGTMWLAEDAIWITVDEQTPVADPRADKVRERDPATFNRQPADLPPARAVNIKLSFVGANPHPRIEPFDRLDTVVSYFIGNDPDKWRPDVPVWGGMRYVDLYPGVDLEITSEGGQMVQRLTPRPGADLSAVRLRGEGADAVTVEGEMLRLSTAAGDAIVPLLQADQMEVGGAQAQPLGAQTFDVTTPFALMSVNLQSAIRSPQSVADNPTNLVYGTFLGEASATSLTVDESGAAYVTGGAMANFPTTPGAFDRSQNDEYGDAFVAKLNPSGSALVYATFLGGSDGERGVGIAVDDVGQAYVTGNTRSSNFPTTLGAFDRSFNGGDVMLGEIDSFVAKLTQTGSALAYSTFLGGTNTDHATAIAVDLAGSAYTTGMTYSFDFPVGPGYDTSYNVGACYDSYCPDAFVVKFVPSGATLSYATFLGGTKADSASAIAVGSTGTAFLTGSTTSPDFPTKYGYDGSINGSICSVIGSHASYCSDAYVTVLNPTGRGLLYSTFLGGSNDDDGHSLAVDGEGRIYVTGTTKSSDFPTTPGTFDRSYNGGTDGDAFVAKLNPATSALAYATFVGGSDNDRSTGITVNGAGNAYVTGHTLSGNFPTTPDAFDTSHNGGEYDAFVAKVSPAGSGLTFATFLGGSDWDIGSTLAIDGTGCAYVAGDTRSSNFPTTPGAFDGTYNAGSAFVVKLAMGSASPPTPTPTYTISGRVTEAGGSTGIPGVTVWAGTTRSTTTDANGNYTFAGLSAGTYNISPSRYLHAFSPPLRTVIVPPNATGQDFVQTPVVDLSVNRIEVGQVFVEQNDPISGTPIPLIAEKDTLVRVYVGLTGAPSVYAVTARLHLRNAFGIEHTITKSANLWPVQVTQNPDPLRLQDTINFRPPPEWLWGGITFWADVDPENRIPETDESNNTGGQVSKTFQAGKPLRIAWTMMGYKSSSSSIVAFPSWNVAAKGDKALRRVYPVGVDDVEYFYQPGILEVLTVKFNEETAAYRKAANRFWDSVTHSSSWIGGTPDRLYTWIPGEARDSSTTCGVGDAVWDPDSPGYGRAAVGAAECNKEFAGILKEISPDEVMAHELGHILNSQGLRHTPNDASAECFSAPGGPGPYPTATPKGSIIAHGLDIERLKVLDPEHTYDFMTYCKPTWASPFNYQKLYAGFEAPPSSNVAEAQSMSSTRQLLVSGMVYSPTMRIELDPFYSALSTALPSPNIGSDYCVEALAANGSRLASRCFDLGFSHSEFGPSLEPATEVADSFALSMPYPSGTTRVVLTHLGTPLASRTVSPHAPTVRLLSPNGGEDWSGSGAHTVTWTASDLDGDPLHFALAYSTDGGASWIPAGLDLTGTQHSLDVSMLPGGTSVLLRISATDGVNTTDDVSDAPFTVGRKAPMAFVLSPEDGARFFPGQAIWLEGRAFDLEDEALDDAALRWSSDRDGELGTGKLLIATLSPGEHVITLTATDSDGARTTATIRLSAGDQLFLPMVLRGR